MGAFSILNNISAINGQHQLNLNNVNLNRTLNRMASGLRINSGADDAAGLQIADTLRGNVAALNQAIRNANDGLSFLQIADGALSEITNMLTRMVTLAEEAANEPIDERGRMALNNEFQELQAEIARLSKQTNFNGTYLFKEGRAFGNTLDLFVGDLSGPSSISVVMGYLSVTNASFSAGNDAKAAIMDATAAVAAANSALSLATPGTVAYTQAQAALAKAQAELSTAQKADAAIESLARQAMDFAALATGLTTSQSTSLSALGTAGTTGLADMEGYVAKWKNMIETGTAAEKQEAKLLLDRFNMVFDGRDKIVGFMRDENTINARLDNINLLTHKSASNALSESVSSIRDALNEISNMRGTIGAGMNRLQAGVAVMQTQARNTLSAESQIRDANMAEEITNMTKFQILAQTGIAALAHSNSNSQMVLRLLQ